MIIIIMLVSLSSTCYMQVGVGADQNQFCPDDICGEMSLP